MEFALPERCFDHGMPIHWQIERSMRFVVLLILLISARVVCVPFNDCEQHTDLPVDWTSIKTELWESIETRSLSRQLLARLVLMRSLPRLFSECPLIGATVNATLATFTEDSTTTISQDTMEASFQLFRLGIPLEHMLASKIPVFNAVEWLADLSHEQASHGCDGQLAQELQSALAYHVAQGSEVPALHALEFVRLTPQSHMCPAGKSAALLSLALTYTNHQTGSGKSRKFIQQAEELLKAIDTQGPNELIRSGQQWFIWTLLRRLAQKVGGSAQQHQRRQQQQQQQQQRQRHEVLHQSPSGCIIIIYAFPTSEIKNDTARALLALEKHYFEHLDVRYPLVVFSDAETSQTIQKDLATFTTAPVWPAVIPDSELKRHMSSYSCVDGVHCETGNVAMNGSHRGVFNHTQFWSADYLRISRYTAGPLFMHPVLDRCGSFLKIDTDLFLTGPIHRDPIKELQDESSQLAYWQIHVQGQRQAGYMEAAVSFLKSRALTIKNRAFYARGRFEEKAEKLGVQVSDVPEILEAATVIYGCLFGGDVRFFRAPLYQEFFAYMDAWQGFERYGWSNQFFLGTAAAAFLWPSQVRRLYISGRHQESRIDVANGTVTEFLLGSSKGVFR